MENINIGLFVAFYILVSVLGFRVINTLQDIRTFTSEQRDATWCLYEYEVQGHQSSYCVGENHTY